MVLRKLGILDETIIIVTADHGESLGEHGLMGHKLGLYDTLVRVPLIIKYPRLFPKGIVSSRLVQLVDIFPTLLELAGIKEKEKMNSQGISIISLLNGVKNRAYTFSEQAFPDPEVFKVFEIKDAVLDVTAYKTDLKAIRTANYKYIYSSNQTEQLFNIREDPGEKKNLIDIFTAEAEKLKKELFTFTNSQNSRKKKESGKLDEYTKKQLQGLGYF